MYKECDRQAIYAMPILEDDADVPQTEEGEDLGIGETWWHTGRRLPTPP
jgi:cytochrome b pre-mRNA-processing protein 3